MVKDETQAARMATYSKHVWLRTHSPKIQYLRVPTEYRPPSSWYMDACVRACGLWCRPRPPEGAPLGPALAIALRSGRVVGERTGRAGRAQPMPKFRPPESGQPAIFPFRL
jgi:hypothetical protein